MTSRPITVLAVDDHPILRGGIVAVIEDEGDMKVVGEAATAGEALSIYASCRPDIVLMDLQLPDMSGLEAIISLRRAHPSARIIVLTTYEGDVLARRALKAGAVGYLLKSMIRKDLVDAIRIVHAGRKHIPESIATSLAEHCQDDDLTGREVEVLKALSEGISNKIIASRLFISEATVKAHMKSILQKLGASDRTHAVGIATIRGFLM